MPVKTETQFGNPASKKPFTIIVEGNIGMSLSTTCNLIFLFYEECMFDFDSISMLDPSLNVFISMQDQVISKNTVEKVHNAVPL